MICYACRYKSVVCHYVAHLVKKLLYIHDFFLTFLTFCLTLCALVSKPRNEANCGVCVIKYALPLFNLLDSDLLGNHMIWISTIHISTCPVNSTSTTMTWPIYAGSAWAWFVTYRKILQSKDSQQGKKTMSMNTTIASITKQSKLVMVVI